MRDDPNNDADVCLAVPVSRPLSGPRALLWALLAVFGGYAWPAAADRSIPPGRLADLSLEELMDVEVTSVSKNQERLLDAAAAVAVVTGKDIRRSGATTVPEALRLVPGLHVAQLDASRWAVSARGFSSSNSEKLLVLSDGRSLYAPLLSGVNWEVQDFLLNDIERIEVIRGPGASLWGSNAVNGVINITSKSARDTQGAYVETAVGTEAELVAAARYGGKASEHMHYRVYGKHSKYDESYAPHARSPDDWSLGHVGFRADLEVSADAVVTLQGDAYRGKIGQLVPAVRIIGVPGPQSDFETEVSGGNFLARWERGLADGANVRLRAYYDRAEHDAPSYDDRSEAFDVEFQHRFNLTERQELTWGLNYRHTESRTEGTGLMVLDPARSRDELFSAFFQDKIALTETLNLTLGSKVEHNDFSGFEVQPTLRFAWNMTSRHMIWGAVSKAVRVPTRYERDVIADITPPGVSPVFRLEGNSDFDSEELVAYELGYRWQAKSNLAVDLASFYNSYDELSAIEFGAESYLDPNDGRTVLPLTWQNANAGRAQGIEALITYNPLPTWRLSGSYAYLDMQIDAGGGDINRNVFMEDATPRHQFGLRSSMDLAAGVELDLLFRYQSGIRRIPKIISDEGLPAYAELDVRVARMFGPHLEVSLVGRNLLDHRHPEFGAPQIRGEVERSVYGKIVWHH